VLGVAEAAPGTPAPVLRGAGGFALYTGPVPTAALPALAPAPALQDGARLGHVTVRHGPDGALRRMRRPWRSRRMTGSRTCRASQSPRLQRTRGL